MKQISDPRNHRSMATLGRRLSLALAVLVISAASLDGRDHEDSAQGPVHEWSVEIGHVYRELAAEQIGPALRAWQRARAAARASREWQGLLAVGDAYLRIGDAVDFRRAFVATARDTYLEALERAHDTASAEGAEGVTAALGTLDDCSVMDRAAREADQALASGDQHADAETRRACEGARL